MRADRNWRSTSGGVLAVCVLAVATAGGTALAASAHTTAKPTTEFQCKKAFAKGSHQRAACIKRIKSEKPGISCKHPLFSGRAVDNGTAQKSDLKDFIVNEKIDRTHLSGEVGFKNTVTFQAEVVVHNPRVVLCRVEVVEFEGKGRHWPLKISPHGGLSSELTLENSIHIAILGYARYTATRG
jgi:hypothetical protein